MSANVLSPTPAKKPTFKQWLKAYRGNVRIVDLAGEIRQDGQFPYLKNSARPGLKHLDALGVGTLPKEILIDAWRQYCKETGIVDKTRYTYDEKEYLGENDDDFQDEDEEENDD